MTVQDPCLPRVDTKGRSHQPICVPWLCARRCDESAAFTGRAQPSCWVSAAETCHPSFVGAKNEGQRGWRPPPLEGAGVETPPRAASEAAGWLAFRRPLRLLTRDVPGRHGHAVSATWRGPRKHVPAPAQPREAMWWVSFQCLAAASPGARSSGRAVPAPGGGPGFSGRKLRRGDCYTDWF